MISLIAVPVQFLVPAQAPGQGAGRSQHRDSRRRSRLEQYDFMQNQAGFKEMARLNSNLNCWTKLVAALG